MEKLKRRYKNKKQRCTILIITLVLFCIISLTIGFSAYQASLDIDNIGVEVRVNANIRVVGVTTTNSVGGSESQNTDYNVNNINAKLYLPNASSTITYQVEVLNTGNVMQGVYAIDEVYKRFGTQIDSNLEIKNTSLVLKQPLCDDSNPSQCKLGTTTTFTITIGYANGAYDGVNLNHDIRIDFDFERVFNIEYNGFTSTSGLPSTMIQCDTLSIPFTSTNPIPSDVEVIGASSDWPTNSPSLYLSNITASGVNDSIVINRKYSLTYTGFSGQTSSLPSSILYSGGSITFNNTTGIPQNLTITGATGDWPTSSPQLNLSNITGDITIAASSSGGGEPTPVEDDTTNEYDPNNIPPNSVITYKAIDGQPKVTTDEDGKITEFTFTDVSDSDPVQITSSNSLQTGFIPFDGSSDWELNMTFSYDSEANSSTSNAKIVSVLGASDWSTGTLTSGFTFRFYNFKNVAGTTSTYRFNGMLKYRPQLQVENNGDIDTLLGLFITGSSGVFMTSPMVYTVHIIKNGNNMTFELSNGSVLNYHPTKNNNTGYSVANPNTVKTVTWTDNGSSSNMDIIIGGYMSSSGSVSQQSNIGVYYFSVTKTN